MTATATTPAPPVVEVRRPRAAAAAIFGVVGLYLGTWFARLPQLREQLDLSYAQLGTVLLAQMVGVIVAMQIAGQFAGRFGSRTVVRATAVVVPWFLPLMTVVPGVWAAVVGMFGWGLVAGLLDVAMNTQGVEVERAARRPVLNSLHAAWAVGALAGAFSATAAIRAGIPLTTHYLALAATLCVIALVSGRFLLDVPAAGGDRPRAPRPGFFTGWTRAVLVLGGLGAATAFCDGAISSWCGVFLQERRGAAAGVASLGYTAYVVAQTVTRMVGDRLHDRFGAVTLVRASVVITMAGVVLSAAVPHVWSAIAGFAIQGCGLAVVGPLIAGAVGHGSADGGTAAALALARYSTVHYAGLVAGPSLIGWLAEAAGIGSVLWLLLPPLAGIGLLAAMTAPASRARRAVGAAT
ncbi:MFS transporter [Catellatospora tritici]|uniref:MFS transporter n=1 Tax=Catellatospora tritici TaxID=2851566 RepID=UPI001C2D22E4|nr:MFS transporter [Catellatospora tritici]MBV1849427.1 MFS transporter [Catellatospora tritici]